MDTKRLTEMLSKELEISKEEVDTLIEGLANVVGECASNLDTVNLSGFGSFEPRKRLERVAVHPASGKRLLVPPKIVLSFRPSTSLKQKIRNGN
ncbi:MAG: HU family DNA-binding protein [Muribaculaceae bacterium]|nr:HU family DNA-binding protein [Muribaculaceae bacterium]MDE6008693.1 HU family DNA-binding protein [Muribaculaceae bacterium]MDE6792051.1 HU family DNA-binding protein [Muribaculaceae bacterium]